MKQAISPITSIKNVKSVKSGLLESVLKLRSTILYFFKAKVLITNQEHLLRGQITIKKKSIFQSLSEAGQLKGWLHPSSQSARTPLCFCR